MLSSDFDDYDSIDFSVLAEALNLSDCISLKVLETKTLIMINLK